METTREPVEQQQYLTFLLAGEEYALTIAKVKEIIEYVTITIVPKTPSWIRGVINLRGAVVPVVDLAVKFGMEARPVTKTTCIVILEGCFEDQSTPVGVITDSVSQVIGLSRDEVRDPPSFGTRVRVDYLLGVAELGKKFALILDVEKVLSTDELLSLSEVPELLTSAAAQTADDTGNPVDTLPIVMEQQQEAQQPTEL
jgi:purine-binding chemotaxis protein CheW